MSKKAEGIFLWIIAILILSLVILLIMFLIGMGNIEMSEKQTPPCLGTCERLCEENEEQVDSSSCTFMRPFCCSDLYDDPYDNQD